MQLLKNTPGFKIKGLHLKAEKSCHYQCFGIHFDINMAEDRAECFKNTFLVCKLYFTMHNQFILKKSNYLYFLENLFAQISVLSYVGQPHSFKKDVSFKRDCIDCIAELSANKAKKDKLMVLFWVCGGLLQGSYTAHKTCKMEEADIDHVHCFCFNHYIWWVTSLTYCNAENMQW